MDEQDQAQQALMKMFRRDQAEAKARPGREPSPRLDPGVRTWILTTAVVAFILFPVTFLVVYPRFGPYDTMTSFCNAEGEGEYKTAYALLFRRVQQRMSLDAFTKASQSANLLSCSTPNGIPFIFGSTQASLEVTYSVGGGDQPQGIAGTMSFVNDGGAWRVDALAPDLFNISS
jgi:hypothetical protein